MRDSNPARNPTSTGDVSGGPCCEGTGQFDSLWASSPVSPLETTGLVTSLGVSGAVRERLRVSILDGEDAPDEAREPRPRRASLIVFDWEAALSSEACDPDLANFVLFGTGLIKTGGKAALVIGLKDHLFQTTCDFQSD